MIALSRDEARRYLIGQSGLRAVVHPTGDAGIRALLLARRCIQLDPIDRIGTNADLVAAARVDDIKKGQVYSALLPGHAFEHFAKERCLLPAHAFPWYRDQAVQTPWWRLTERLKRLDEAVIAAVRDEVASRGPSTAAALRSHGKVTALDWNGWSGTSNATSMALEVLWTRCQVVVFRRTPQGKQYAAPHHGLPEHASRPTDGDFARWALLERVEAAGLLARASGPHWSMLGAVRKTLPDVLVAEGLLEEVVVEGSRRPYLAPAGFRARTFPEDDGRMRIIGPLDPFVWDRKLIQHLFDFAYIWEVYKPAPKRRWGFYVCPLLHRGALVGRIEAHVEGDALIVDRLWEEPRVDRAALRGALKRHQRFLDLKRIQLD